MVMPRPFLPSLQRIVARTARYVLWFRSFERNVDPRSLRQCGVVSTTPFLSVSELATYYHADYYGGEKTNRNRKQIPSLVGVARQTRERKARPDRFAPFGAIRDPTWSRTWSTVAMEFVGRRMRPRGFLEVACAIGASVHGTDITPFSSLATSGITFLQGKLQDLQLPSGLSMGFGSGTCSSTRPTQPKPSKRFRDCCATMGLSPSPFPISIVGNEGSSVGIGSTSICRGTNFISAALPCSDCCRRMALSRFEWRR